MQNLIRGLIRNRTRDWVKCETYIFGGRNASTHTKPEFTSVRYNVERGPYANLSDKDVTYFTGLLGQSRVITDPDECYGYNVDWIKTMRGVIEKYFEKNITLILIQLK